VGGAALAASDERSGTGLGESVGVGVAAVGAGAGAAPEGSGARVLGAAVIVGEACAAVALSTDRTGSAVVPQAASMTTVRKLSARRVGLGIIYLKTLPASGVTHRVHVAHAHCCAYSDWPGRRNHD
jgi:hypothetical protein